MLRRLGPPTAALACAAVLTGCSFSLSIGDPDEADRPDREWSAATEPGQDAVRADASELSWAVNDMLTHRRGSTWENLELPTAGPIPDGKLSDFGVSLTKGNAAHVSDYQDRFEFTVCVDRNGSGPSVSYRTHGNDITASESTDPCA